MSSFDPILIDVLFFLYFLNLTYLIGINLKFSRRFKKQEEIIKKLERDMEIPF